MAILLPVLDGGAVSICRTSPMIRRASRIATGLVLAHLPAMRAADRSRLAGRCRFSLVFELKSSWSFHCDMSLLCLLSQVFLLSNPLLLPFSKKRHITH
jgi:hypothetical protein